MKKDNSSFLIYQTEDGKVKIETHFERETIWLNIEQIAELFQRDRSVVSRHIRNSFKEGELDEKLVCANFAHTTRHGAIENKTQTKNVRAYNLDVIISVGYRVKSHRGVHFRKWATALLEIAEIQALDRTPMYMADWIKQLDSFLKMTNKEILQHSGTISHQKAIEKAHTEYEIYKEKIKNRITQVEKDFMKEIENKTKNLKKLNIVESTPKSHIFINPTF